MIQCNIPITMRKRSIWEFSMGGYIENKFSIKNKFNPFPSPPQTTFSDPPPPTSSAVEEICPPTKKKKGKRTGNFEELFSLSLFYMATFLAYTFFNSLMIQCNIEHPYCYYHQKKKHLGLHQGGGGAIYRGFIYIRKYN